MTQLPVIQRKCGNCSECCFVLSVNEGLLVTDAETGAVVTDAPTLQKPRYERCPHQKTQGNHCCGIYDTRPEACRTYACAWLYGLGSNALRPDKSGIVFSLNTTLLGLTLLGLESKKGAANRQNPMVLLALKMAEKNNSGLIIGDRDRRVILRVPADKEGAVQAAIQQAAIQQAQQDGYQLSRG